MVEDQRIAQAQASLDAVQTSQDAALKCAQERVPVEWATPIRTDAVVVKPRGPLRRLLHLKQRKRVLRGNPHPPATPRGWELLGLVYLPAGSTKPRVSVARGHLASELFDDH